MLRHLWTIVTIVMCSGGLTGYSLIRVASLADAADEAIVAQATRDSDEPDRHRS